MQIQAIYDNGKLKFIDKVAFKHQRFNVIVEVPESELAPTESELSIKEDYSNTSLSNDGSLTASLAKIMGSAYKQRPSVIPESDREQMIAIMEARHQHG